MKRIFTKGNVEVQNIKVGDIHYEFGYGSVIKSEVVELPKESERQKGLWEWKSKSGDKVINYAVAEGHGHYGPNLYDYMAYTGCKEI